MAAEYPLDCGTTFDILTIFPDLFSSVLQEGIIRRARQAGQINIRLINLRDFARDRHAMTDDRPFGGGEGMVMKPEPIVRAIEHCRKADQQNTVILLSPQGKKFDQQKALELAEQKHLIMICGRYEGVDGRIAAHFIDEEISIGDYILSGGEIGALVLVDSITRLLPGVLGRQESADNDTFSHGLLKYRQYTRPQRYRTFDVPEVLLSGNHAAIAESRFADSVRQTLEKRPDLLENFTFSAIELKILKKYGLQIESRRTDRTGAAITASGFHGES